MMLVAGLVGCWFLLLACGTTRESAGEVNSPPVPGEGAVANDECRRPHPPADGGALVLASRVSFSQLETTIEASDALHRVAVKDAMVTLCTFKGPVNPSPTTTTCPDGESYEIPARTDLVYAVGKNGSLVRVELKSHVGEDVLCPKSGP